MTGTVSGTTPSQAPPPAQRPRNSCASPYWFLDRDFVVPTSQVLYQTMPGNHDPGATVLVEPAHRSQPRLEAAVVALDPVVGVLVGGVPGCWQQVLEHDRVCRCLVGSDLDGRHLRHLGGLSKEPGGPP